MADEGLYTDFKVYEPEFYAGMAEGIAQNIQAFNAASQGGIRLVARSVKGHYEKESFIQDVANLITHRDIGSVAAASVLKMEQDDFISVKVNRKIGPVVHSRDSWRKIGSDAREMSFQLGRMVGEKQPQDYLNTSLIAGRCALDSVANVETDGTGDSPGTLTPSYLATAMSKLGDASSRLVCWVMHSKPFFNLVGNAITEKVTGLTDVVVYGGGPGTLGRPVIVTDSTALTGTTGGTAPTTIYHVLGLQSNGLVVTESEEREIASQDVLLKENLLLAIQGEYAFNLGVKGFKWDTTTGGINPTDATIGTAGNWDAVATSHKDLAGVLLKVK